LIKLLVLFLLLTNTLSGAEKNDWKRDNLKSKVKEFTEKGYAVEYKSGRPIKMMIFRKVRRYDTNGNNIDESEYRYGTFFEKYVDRYNNAGNRMKGIILYPNENFKRQTNFKYISNENIVENIEDISSVSLYSKNLYKYDKKGNIIEWANYKSDGSLFLKYNYKYESKGNMIENTFYRADGTLKWKTIYKYDDKKNIIEKMVYKYGSPYSRYTFEYDWAGNMTEEAQYVYEDESGEEKMKLIWIYVYEYKYWYN